MCDLLVEGVLEAVHHLLPHLAILVGEGRDEPLKHAVRRHHIFHHGGKQHLCLLSYGILAVTCNIAHQSVTDTTPPVHNT